MLPEPISAATGTLIVTGAAVPVLTIAGVSLGLRADLLLAGFLGAVAAIALLNTVPSKNDTWRELFRTSFRRVGVALACSFVAGYLTPIYINEHAALSTFLGNAFVIGAGAQKFLNMWIDALTKKKILEQGAKPEVTP